MREAALWIDSVEVELNGGNVLVKPVSNGVEFARLTSRAVAVKLARDIMRLVEQAERADRACVLPFKNTA